MKTETEIKKGVYEIMTDHIISLLEKGTIPWKQPWSQKEVPQNLLNRIPYRGINMILLSAFNFERNYFLTYNQIKNLSISIKKGAKSIPIVFWRWPQEHKPDEGENIEVDEEKKKKPVLRYYTVYNIADCINVPDKLIPPIGTRTNFPILDCAQVVEGMPNPPRILHDKNEAFYSPSLDTVNVPDIKYFDSSESYYATLFHELIHSTGHETRLDRKEGMKNISFGSDQYSIEELVAELGACFLEAQTGISSKELENNAAYLNGWLTRLKKDSRFILIASSQAQKAADYIVNGTKMSEVDPDEKKETDKKTRTRKATKSMGDESHEAAKD